MKLLATWVNQEAYSNCLLYEVVLNVQYWLDVRDEMFAFTQHLDSQVGQP